MQSRHLLVVSLLKERTDHVDLDCLLAANILLCAKARDHDVNKIHATVVAEAVDRCHACLRRTHAVHA